MNFINVGRLNLRIVYIFTIALRACTTPVGSAFFMKIHSTIFTIMTRRSNSFNIFIRICPIFIAYRTKLIIIFYPWTRVAKQWFVVEIFILWGEARCMVGSRVTTSAGESWITNPGIKFDFSYVWPETFNMVGIATYLATHHIQCVFFIVT